MIRTFLFAIFAFMIIVTYHEKNKNSKDLIVGRWYKEKVLSNYYVYNYSNSTWQNTNDLKNYSVGAFYAEAYEFHSNKYFCFLDEDVWVVGK
jgi:hypothetical protein